MHLPITAANAMTIAIPPAVLPKEVATREIFVSIFPGARTLTSMAAEINAMNALILKPMIKTSTATIPMARTTSG